MKVFNIIGAAAILFTALALLSVRPEWVDPMRLNLDRNLSFGLFLALMAVLPVFGFPISAFLILGGLRFGIGLGLVAMLITFPLHLLVVSLVTRSFLRPRIEAMLNRRLHSLPKIPARRAILYTSLFVAVPSLPYAVKNYLLLLGGLSPRLCYGLALPVHLVVGAPFVLLGESVISINIGLSLTIAALVLIGQGLMHSLGRRLAGNPKARDESNASPNLDHRGQKHG